MVRLQDMAAFQHCKVKDWERLQLMIDDMIKSGPPRLQIVSDFDFTITKQHNDNGKEVPTSFGLFQKCNSIPNNYKEKTQALFLKYRPIEIDPNIPKAEKVKAMIDWWSQSGLLLKGFSFKQSELDELAAQHVDCLRENSKKLFDTLYRLDVPVLVFSAGLGHSVFAMLKQAHMLHSNMRIISNFLQMSEDGTVDGFMPPMIHTFNKNETSLQGSDYFDLVHNRDHIILMGDALADAGMADGVPSSSHIIKIGFLYDHVEENLERYMNAYDIVLVDDQTMNVPLALIDLIEQPHKSI